jgi:2-amino-4-hydroxy-6-hydroxymethyldihydropteridine diphosphokinase
VVIGDTDQTPEALLDVLLDLERQRGRVRSYRLAPRTLDLDLILYEGTVRDTMGLVLPHPRFRARRFVLAPLVELAPEWKDPVTGRTALELLEALDGEGGAKPPHPPV